MTLSENVEAFRNQLKTLVQTNLGRPELAKVGANIGIAIVPDIALWTIVIEGKDAGFYEEKTSHPVQFILVCAEPVLDALVNNPDADLTPFLESGEMEFQGDISAFERLMELREGLSALDLRMGR